MTRPFSFDTETWGCLDLAVHPAPPLVCCSWQVDGLAPGICKGKAESVAKFRELMHIPDTVCVGVNLVFDLGVLCATDPTLLPEVFDGLEKGRFRDCSLRERLHDIARGCLDVDPTTGQRFAYSLAALEARYCGRDRSAEKTDGWRLRYHELEDVPLEKWPAEAVEYPLNDARGTLEVYKAQAGHLNLQCEPQEMRAAWALKLMSLWGIRTDKKTVGEVVGEIEKAHESSRHKFFKAGFIAKRKPRGGKNPETPDGFDGDIPFKWVTKKAPIQALVEQAYDGNPPLTAKGAISTDRDCLTESGDALLEALGEASETEKLKTTYAQVLRLGTEVPIHVSFNSLLTSQRASCRSPNLMQLPRGRPSFPLASRIRESFIPRPSHLLLSTDYSTLEMVTLAQNCLDLGLDSKMAEALNADQDLHTRLAARMDATTYEAAIARLKAGDKHMKNLRQAAKPVNFGIPGGMTGPKIALTARKQGVRFCELSGELVECGSEGKAHEYRGRQISPTCVVCLDLAVKYGALFFEEWPEVAEYHAIVKLVVDSGEPLASMAEGKMLRLESGFCAAANHFFQSRAAVLAKDATWHVVRAFRDQAYGSSLYGLGSAVLFIHDEIISEVREDFAHECALEQSRIMEVVGQKHVPDVKLKAPPALMRCWYKAAEPKYESGRLVPWTP
jgi:hypothetical protein